MAMMKIQQRFGLVLAVMMAACFGVCLGAGFYGGNSAVVSLTRSNFAQKVLNDDHVWLVEFYAPWCGHCQRLTPEWEKAAANLKGLVRVGAINCDEEKEFCGGFGIQGFPTIKLFPSEKTGANKKPIDYQQQRTAAAIVKFALGFLPNYSTTLTAANAEKFLAQDKTKVLLFSNKPETTSLWKALTVDFKGRLNFAEVKHTQKALVDQFEVKNYPTLIVVKEGGEKVVYDGKLAHEDIFKFLSQFAPAQQQQSTSSGQQQKAQPMEDLPAAVHEVQTQADFEKHCTSKAGSCVIAFLDTEDEEGKRKERDLAMLLKLAEKYKKSFHFVWMDGSKNFELADALGTTLLPSLSVYNHGKKAYVPLFGAFEEKALGEYLNKVLTNKKPAVPVPLTLPLPAVSASS